jgi:hypothetical protein
MKYKTEIIINDLNNSESWKLSENEIGILEWIIDAQIKTHNELLDTQPYKRAEWSEMLHELAFLEKFHLSITGEKQAE